MGAGGSHFTAYPLGRGSAQSFEVFGPPPGHPRPPQDLHQSAFWRPLCGLAGTVKSENKRLSTATPSQVYWSAFEPPWGKQKTYAPRSTTVHHARRASRKPMTRPDSKCGDVWPTFAHRGCRVAPRTPASYGNGRTETSWHPHEACGDLTYRARVGSLVRRMWNLPKPLTLHKGRMFAEQSRQLLSRITECVRASVAARTACALSAFLSNSLIA